jgi:hypothetical protein
LCLVLGAGCSIDPPTGLNTGSEYAVDAHRKLVDANVIGPADCADPSDLALLADVVFERTVPKSQRLLVEQLPRAGFRDAEPNEGHLVAVALLVEQIVGLLLTVNIDMALDHAASFVGSKHSLSIVHGPAEHGQLGRFSIVYLHGCATSDADSWILRASQMEDAWRDGWQELQTLQAAMMPTVVFAGLGSPAPVLTQTIERVRAALPGSTEVFQVDAAEFARNRFAAILGIDEPHYVFDAWLNFMHDVSRLFARQHLSELRSTCATFERANGLSPTPHADVIGVLPEDMLVLGKLRALWFLEKSQYKALIHLDAALIADLITTVALAKEVVRADNIIPIEDCFELRRGTTLCRIVPVSGGGSKRWAAIENRVDERAEEWRRRDPGTLVVVLLTGVADADTVLSAPSIVVPGPRPHSIMGGPAHFIRLTASRLRSNPDDLAKAVA